MQTKNFYQYFKLKSKIFLGDTLNLKWAIFRFYAEIQKSLSQINTKYEAKVSQNIFERFKRFFKHCCLS